SQLSRSAEESPLKEFSVSHADPTDPAPETFFAQKSLGKSAKTRGDAAEKPEALGERVLRETRRDI
ncbi:MAG: hypothetical protein ACKOWG_11945, partial [Planctomycetia bacterium]